MRRVPVPVTPPYEVVVGTGVLGEVDRLVAGSRRVAVVTQEAVMQHAAAVAEALRPDTSLTTIGAGESAKTMSTVERICRELAASGVLRGDVVVAVGGGVVGDTAGFAAAVYHRGVAVVQVPTTLLAQVDAAIGGKTAVNLPEGKNLVGAFHQPRGVVADIATLATLPNPEYRTGLGEVAKYALMGDDELEVILATRADDIRSRAPDVLEEIVARGAATKAAVVAADEEERTGVRATLNYGHTLAHALETLSEYELAHGEAVGIGLVFAGELAGALERIDPDRAAGHRRLVEALGLPSRSPFAVSADDARAVMARDKKSDGGLTFVLAGPDGLETVVDPPAAAVDRALAAVGIEAG